MEFAHVHEASQHENVILYRGLAVFGGLVAGAGLALGLDLRFPLPLAAPADIVGPMAMGWAHAQQAWAAVLVLAGALAGAAISWWLWLRLAHLQTLLCPLPPLAALKRAAVPFAAFLPQVTLLVQGRPVLAAPFILFAGLGLGYLLLAVCERGDKRKIYFAHPTETEYHPSALFTHGAVICLGAGLGWYLQSLPGLHAVAEMGIWAAAGAGIGVWILSLILALGVKLLVSKKTFHQVYLAVALALLPLALLPLQSMGWFQFVSRGQAAGGLQLAFLPILLACASGIGLVAILTLGIIALRNRPVEIQPAWEELFRALILISAAPLLILSLAYWPAGGPLGGQDLGRALDWFKDGEGLASAQALLAGRLPFKEILFVHGLGSDALTGLAAMSWFGPTLEAYRFLLTWLTPLGLASFYLLAIFCLPWVWALALVLTMVTGSLGIMTEARFFFTYLGFLFTLVYLQRGKWAFLIFSGVFTSLAFLVSYSAGLLALAGHGVLLAAYVPFGPAENKNRLLGLGAYAGSTLLALMPWWLYLGMSNSLTAYFQNFNWVLAAVQPVFSLGLPNWGTAPGWGRIILFVLPPAAALAGILNVAAALPKARERGLPWNVLLMTVLTLLLWWRFLGNGQFTLLLEALPVAAMLLAFILFRLTAHNPMLRGLIFFLALLAVLVPSQAHLTLTEMIGGFGTKNCIPADGLVKTSLGPLGNLPLPAQQAKDTDGLVKYLEGEVGSAESFFDFSNAPLLYFLVARKPVVKSLASALLATWDQQLEAIGNLNDNRVKAVVFNGPQAFDLDGIPGEVRQYAMSEYLLRRYVPVAKAGGAVILAPRGEALMTDAAAQAAMSRPLALEDLPLLWGKLSKYDPGQGNGAGVYAPAGGVRAVEPAGLTVTAAGDQLSIGACSTEVRLRLSGKPDPSNPANVLVLQLQAGPGLDRKPARLAWGEPASGRSLTFRLCGDNQAHHYAIRVGSLPSWVLAGEIANLDLTLPAGNWSFAKAQLLALKDIPELATLAAVSHAPAEKPAAQSAAPKPAPVPSKPRRK